MHAKPHIWPDAPDETSTCRIRYAPGGGRGAHAECTTGTAALGRTQVHTQECTTAHAPEECFSHYSISQHSRVWRCRAGACTAGGRLLRPCTALYNRGCTAPSDVRALSTCMDLTGNNLGREALPARNRSTMTSSGSRCKHTVRHLVVHVVWCCGEEWCMWGFQCQSVWATAAHFQGGQCSHCGRRICTACCPAEACDGQLGP
jgi:hypothetical protein